MAGLNWADQTIFTGDNPLSALLLKEHLLSMSGSSTMYAKRNMACSPKKSQTWALSFIRLV